MECEYPSIHAVLIERNGFLVYEEYIAGEDVRSAGGNGGQRVFVLPDYRVVVTILAGA